ncbi:MAG: GNAT family N-acetyltransferase [Bacteroidales bacterium]|nr:GNAT family N-acetyltransferase [Bacteroidales bacterium]
MIYNSFGILPEYQNRGLASALIYESIRVRNEKPFPEAVSSL